MVKLSFIKADSLDRNCKATVHKTGKLGFTENAIKKLQLDTNKGVMIARNEVDIIDRDNFYLQVVDQTTPDSFRVSKAGAYYYLNTKALFDTLNMDYINDNYSYDIKDFIYENEKMFKLVKREDKKDITVTT
jgi:hypothetical protein